MTGFITVNSACVRLEAKIVLPKPSSAINVGAVVGGVIGGAVFIGAVVVIVMLVKRGKGSSKAKKAASHVMPQADESPVAEGNHAAAIAYTPRMEAAAAAGEKRESVQLVPAIDYRNEVVAAREPSSNHSFHATDMVVEEANISAV